MRLPSLYDTFERKQTLGEIFLWTGIFFVGLILLLWSLQYLLWPLFALYDYFYPIPD
ncbi:MAG: hypothetical protein JO360_14655 [Acidobacteria bacterium]|nr:hypothetical protein [Acidobacteriota bacterium]